MYDKSLSPIIVVIFTCVKLAHSLQTFQLKTYYFASYLPEFANVFSKFVASQSFSNEKKNTWVGRRLYTPFTGISKLLRNCSSGFNRELFLCRNTKYNIALQEYL